MRRCCRYEKARSDAFLYRSCAVTVFQLIGYRDQLPSGGFKFPAWLKIPVPVCPRACLTRRSVQELQCESPCLSLLALPVPSAPRTPTSRQPELLTRVPFNSTPPQVHSEPARRDHSCPPVKLGL